MFKKYVVRYKETSYFEVQIDAVSKSHAKEIVHSAGLESALQQIPDDTLFDIIEVTQAN
tara:strand:- start:2177 stop:2353 length:177 start_codon:yes stop_codon:yes gene_type:complete